MTPAPWAAHYPFESRRLDLGGHALHYLDEGHGETVVMLHGNPTWSFYYRELVKALRGSYRCIVPDHIGMGLSDKPGSDRYRYTLASRVEDLERLLARVAPKGPVTLVVHDWGGMIGMAWAVRHPERVARIVAMNTSCFRLPEGKAFPWPLRLARTPLGALAIQGGNAFALAASYACALRRPLTAELRRAYLAPYAGWSERVAVLRFVQDIPLRPGDEAWDLVSATENGLHRLRGVPMLLVWGMRDFVFDGDFFEGWKARFPQAEAKAFPDCGHYLLEDAGPEVIPSVQDFLSRHPLESRA